jgi:hypothetical protein
MPEGDARWQSTRRHDGMRKNELTPFFPMTPFFPLASPSLPILFLNKASRCGEELPMAFQVLIASYGALAQSDPNLTRAKKVTGTLQDQLDYVPDGIVTINNLSMGGDPAPGFTKHFGAIVEVGGQTRAFACQENQTINFNKGG